MYSQANPSSQYAILSVPQYIPHPNTYPAPPPQWVNTTSPIPPHQINNHNPGSQNSRMDHSVNTRNSFIQVQQKPSQTQQQNHYNAYIKHPLNARGGNANVVPNSMMDNKTGSTSPMIGTSYIQITPMQHQIRSYPNVAASSIPPTATNPSQMRRKEINSMNTNIQTSNYPINPSYVPVLPMNDNNINKKTKNRYNNNKNNSNSGVNNNNTMMNQKISNHLNSPSNIIVNNTINPSTATTTNATPTTPTSSTSFNSSNIIKPNSEA